MPDDKIHIWMAMDPETRRVQVQSVEFHDGAFPRGLRGAGWPQREMDVDRETFDSLLNTGASWDDQDTIHRTWWNEAAPEGAPEWPYMPGEEIV